MTSDRNFCQATGCTCQIAFDRVMCHEHWSRLPPWHQEKAFMHWFRDDKSHHEPWKIKANQIIARQDANKKKHTNFSRQFRRPHNTDEGAR